jgi:sec-independent protein translocase protein TatB
MFDVSFGELMVIAIVALVVIGPEKMPKVARTLGALMGRAQRYVNSVKADVERELQAQDIQKIHSEFKQAVEHTGQDVRQAVNQVSAPLNEAAQEIKQMEREESASSQPGK